MTGKKDIVVFVDDELHILNAIRRAVMDEPFISMFANSGKEALDLFDTYEVSVLVTDMRMPGMDGLALLKAVRETSPKTVRIVLSGYTQLSQVLATVNQAEIFQFISKPWQMEEELLLVVRRGIERYNLEAERDSLRRGLMQKNNAILNILKEMEQKLANEKKDVASVRHLNHWLFSFWKRHFAMNVGCSPEKKEASVRDIDLIETIQRAYLEALPTAFDSRMISQAVADLEVACAGRLKIKAQMEQDQVVQGYFGILSVIVKIIVYLHGQDSEQPAGMEMTVGRREHELLMITLESKPSTLAKADQARLKIGYALLNEIGRPYDASLIVRRLDEGIEGVQIQWRPMLQSPVKTGNDEKA